MSEASDPNPYAVHVAEADHGWEVQIVQPGGEVVFSRPSADEGDARTFASTVQQHIYWLSPEKFRHYYRLPEAAAT
jgi:hypothetical protein